MTADTLLSSNNAHFFRESMQLFGHLGKTCYKVSIVQCQPQKLPQFSDISGYRVPLDFVSLEGSGANPSLEIMKPMYRTKLCRNEHFFKFSFRLAFKSLSSTNRKCSMCSSKVLEHNKNIINVHKTAFPFKSC